MKNLVAIAFVFVGALGCGHKPAAKTATTPAAVEPAPAPAPAPPVDRSPPQ